MKITMTAAEAIARVKASCAPWWPATYAEFNVQKEGRFRCRELEAAVIYAWHHERGREGDLSDWVTATTAAADRCAKTCRVCKKHERLSPVVKP